MAFGGTLRPNSDVHNNGSWDTSEGDLHSALDETSPDEDTTHVTKFHSGDTEASYTFEVGLSNPGNTPSGSERTVFRIRSKRMDDSSLGSSASITGRILEGNTEIDTFSAPENGTYGTNEEEVDLSGVGNYDNLRVEVTAVLKGGSDNEFGVADIVTVRVTWIELSFEVEITSDLDEQIEAPTATGDGHIGAAVSGDLDKQVEAPTASGTGGTDKTGDLTEEVKAPTASGVAITEKFGDLDKQILVPTVTGSGTVEEPTSGDLDVQVLSVQASGDGRFIPGVDADLDSQVEALTAEGEGKVSRWGFCAAGSGESWGACSGEAEEDWTKDQPADASWTKDTT